MYYAIAIDLGGTKIEAAVVDRDGHIVFSKRFPTETEKGKEQVLDNVLQSVKYCLSNFDQYILSIGISAPGFINEEGDFVFSGNMKELMGANIKNRIKVEVNLPVFVGNDANCFALADATFGISRKYNHVFGVIWGTGIGGAYITNKRAQIGALGGFGEFGHIVLEPSLDDSFKCTCGHSGCLEMFAGGKNIIRRYKEKGGKLEDPTVKDIYESDEKSAREVMDDAIHYLGLGLSMAVNFLNPEVIIIGGGVSKLPNEVYVRLQKEIQRYAIPVMAENVKLERYSISDSEGILGAAALAFEGLKKI